MKKPINTLSNYIDTTYRNKHIKENIEDISLNSTMICKSKTLSKIDNSTLTASTTHRLQIRKRNRKIKAKVYLTQSKYLGIDEGSIELPKIKPNLEIWRKLTPEEQELKQYEELAQMIKLRMKKIKFDSNILFEDEEPEEFNPYEQMKSENEIKKLNGWDMMHAQKNKYLTRRQTNSILKLVEGFDSPTLKWFMDLKTKPLQMELLSRNSHVKDFFLKLEEEQKTIFNQSLNINKKQFNFDVFMKGPAEEKENDDQLVDLEDKKPTRTTVDIYKEVMKNKLKVEEYFRTDLVYLAEGIYANKKKKKDIIQKMIEVIDEINAIEAKKKELLSISTKTQKRNTNDSAFHNLVNNKRAPMKEEKIKKLQLIAENARQIKDTDNDKGFCEEKLKRFQKQLNETEEEIRHLKVKMDSKISNYCQYYFDILKKGIDVRSDGLSWIIIKLIEIKIYLENSKFPIFLNTEQIEYLLQISHMQYELNELIQLFKILKHKQKAMRDKHLKESLLIEIKKEDDSDHIFKRRNTKNSQELFQESNFANKFKSLYAKYENAINICLNEDSEDLYIKTIARELHNKIVKSQEEDETDSEKLYFLPGSLAEYFNESNKFRQYFDDILYLSCEIAKRESDIKEMKRNQMLKFRRETEKKLTKNTIEHEMVFGAIFGNGINI